MSAPLPVDEDLSADFACGCSVDVLDPVLWTLTLWQCPAGEECPAWRLIAGGLERCVRQLRIEALGRSL